MPRRGARAFEAIADNPSGEGEHHPLAVFDVGVDVVNHEITGTM